MAEFVKIGDKTFKFPDRGPQVVDWTDLFDECHYGADQLYFRGRFETCTEVADQIEAALDPAYKDYGGGNPLEKDHKEDGERVYAEGIALNRYNYRDKKFWTPIDPADSYPWKAKYAVQFLLRLHFHDDYGYILVGLPWEKLRLPNGKVNPEYPIKAKYTLNGVKISDLTLLKHWNISRADVAVYLNGVKGSDGQGIPPIDPVLDPEAQMVLEDASIIIDEESSVTSDTVTLKPLDTEDKGQYIEREEV